jgi:phytol kinase
LVNEWIQGVEPTLGVKIGVAALWLAAIAVLSLVLHRWKIVGPEVLRKVVHIGTGNIILIAWWLKIPAAVGIGASILFSAVTLLSYQFPLLPGIDSVGRKSLGTFFYAVSIGVLIACFWTTAPQFAALGILTMTWGDGLAALIGQRWGKHTYQLWGMRKSWEGSLTMLIVGAMVSGLVLLSVYGGSWQTVGIALSVAAVATGLEAFSKLGIDNLTVPLGSAMLAYGLSQWLLTT